MTDTTRLKVGDKVERIEDSFGGMVTGDTDTITLIRSLNSIIALAKYGDGHDIRKFKLISREWDD